VFTRRIAQAGAVVFRAAGGNAEVLLVRAKKQPTQWIFPKGHIDTAERADMAALREAREEAGVVARVVRPLCPPLAFQSGDEAVKVQYYLAVATGEATPSESREQKWLDPDAALQTLTHDAARTMLRAALPDIMEEARLEGQRTARESREDERIGIRELLLAEYEHTAESLLRNEEDGEKRVTFFMTLTGGAGTVLAFALGPKAELGPQTIHPLVVGTILVVLAVGHLTFLRVVTRNLASDRYKAALNRIRRYFLQGPQDSRFVFLPFDPFKREGRARPSWKSLGRGGWLETVALVQSFVAGALGAMVVPTSTWGQDLGVAAVVAAATWTLLLREADRRYRTRDNPRHC
jgi:8-oxo-dGTP pyrophosphatase MutT (NUDIX family)